MIDTDLRKMSRKDLLELLIEQNREIQRLEQELAMSETRARDAAAQAQQRAGSVETRYIVEKAGTSLSEAYEATDAAKNTLIR